MGRAKGEKLIQNRVLAGGFGGLFILAGIALLVVGSMLYLALYEQHKNEQYESTSKLILLLIKFDRLAAHNLNAEINLIIPRRGLLRTRDIYR
jgi:hypothetical protein